MNEMIQNDLSIHEYALERILRSMWWDIFHFDEYFNLVDSFFVFIEQQQKLNIKKHELKCSTHVEAMKM